MFVAKPYREMYRGFVSREDFESRPRSLPAPPGGNRPFEPIGHDELGWHDGPGPGYEAEDAKDAIRRRYKNSLAPIRHTLPRLVRDPRFCALVSELREEGWKDWHVLLAVANAAANERLSRAFPPNAWRSGMIPEMRRLMSEEETREESERLPDSVFSEENLRFSLKTFVTTFAQYFGLETHQRTPDFPGLERLLTERYGLKDDVEHDQVFGPCDET